jgi:hypothetical protein
MPSQCQGFIQSLHERICAVRFMNILEKTHEYFKVYFEGRREVLFQPIVFGQSPKKELVFDKAHEIVDFLYCEEEKNTRDRLVTTLISTFNSSSILILDKKISQEDFLKVAPDMVDNLLGIYHQVQINHIDLKSIILSMVLEEKLSQGLDLKSHTSLIKI